MDAADPDEVDGFWGERGPGFPAVEGFFDIGARNVGSADRHDVAVVGAVGVGHHGDELAGAVVCFGGVGRRSVAPKPQLQRAAVRLVDEIQGHAVVDVHAHSFLPVAMPPAAGAERPQNQGLSVRRAGVRGGAVQAFELVAGGHDETAEDKGGLP